MATLVDVLLAGPISLGYRWHNNTFVQRKDGYSLFPADIMLVPVIFIRVNGVHNTKFILLNAKNSWFTARIELGFLLETIYEANALS